MLGVYCLAAEPKGLITGEEQRASGALGVAVETSVSVCRLIVWSKERRMTTVSFTDYEGLIETLESLADRDLARSIEQGLADAAAGRLVSHEDVWDDVDHRLRD